MNIRYLNRKELSERQLSRQLGLSRSTLRQLLRGEGNPRLSTYVQIADFLDLQYEHFFSPSEPVRSEYCISVVSQLIVLDGVDSWQRHLMNFVDWFRKYPDRRLILNPPVSSLEVHLKCLLASSVHKLCREMKLELPAWVSRVEPLKKPWFVSGVENLKASALVESPASFKLNNIFVLENFLNRV